MPRPEKTALPVPPLRLISMRYLTVRYDINMKPSDLSRPPRTSIPAARHVYARRSGTRSSSVDSRFPTGGQRVHFANLPCRRAR